MINAKYTLNKLAPCFYKDYPRDKYPEMESKRDRPYVVFVVKIDGVRFAIPFRTNIRHAYAYKFKNTTRRTTSVTGIDYSKAVVITKPKYIGAEATIDNKEYVELNNKFYFIIKQFTGYVRGFKKYLNGQANEYMAKRYAFSTLNYFKKELGGN